MLNEAVRDFFVREGRPNDEIVITGNPALDAIYDPAIRAGKIQCAQAGAKGVSQFYTPPTNLNVIHLQVKLGTILCKPH